MIKIKKTNVFDHNIELKDFINKRDFLNEFIQMDLSINNSAENYSIYYNFEFNLCDLNGLKKGILRQSKGYQNKGIIDLKGYNLILVKEYNYDTVIEYLDSIFSHVMEFAEGMGFSKDSDEIARYLNEYLGWIDLF